MMITQGYEKIKLTKLRLFWSTVKTLLVASLIYGGKVNGQHQQNNFQCVEEGYHADLKDCRIYYRCVSWSNSESLTKFQFECGPGTVFSHSKQNVCVHPYESERSECNELENDLDSNIHDSQSNQKVDYPQSSWSGYPQHSTNYPTYIPPKTESTANNEVYPPSTSTLDSTTKKPSYPGESSYYPSLSPEIPSYPKKNESVTPMVPLKGSQCQHEGFMADPNDCKKFIRCVYSSSGSYQKYEFTCGQGTIWDMTIEGCNHEWAVKRDCSSQQNSSGITSSDTTNPNQNSTVNYDKPNSTPSYPANPTQSSGTPSSENNSTPLSELYPPPPYPPSASSTTRLPPITPLTTVPRPTTITQKPSNQPSSMSTKPSTVYLPISMPVTSSKPSSLYPLYSTPSSASTTTTMIPSESDSADSDAQKASTPSGLDCTKEGFFADPKNCRKFYRCVEDNQSFTKYDFECGEGTAWDSSIQVCNHEYNVPQCKQSDNSLGDQSTSNGESNDQLSSTKQSEATTQKQSQSPTLTDRPELTSDTSTLTSTTNKMNPDSSTDDSNTPNSSSSEDSMTTESFVSSEPTSESMTLKPTSSESTSLSSSTSSSTTLKLDESTKTTELMSTMASTTSNKQQNLGSSSCQDEGFFANPEDCRKFYRCVKKNGGYIKFDFDCSPGTAWDQSLLTCNYINLVQSCNSNKMPTSSESEVTKNSTSTTTESYDENIDKDSSPTSSSSNINSTTASMSSTNLNIDMTTTSLNIDDTIISTSEKNNESTEKSTTQSLVNSSESPTNLSTSSISEPKPTESGLGPKPSDKIMCNAPGFYAHPTQCNKFYRCVQNGNGFNIYNFDCPPGTIFDPSISVCNYPESVYPVRDCAGGSSTPSSNSEVTSNEPPNTSEMTTINSLTSEQVTNKPSDETTVIENTQSISESTEALTETTENSMPTEITKVEGTTNLEESTTMTSGEVESTTESSDNTEIIPSSEQTTETQTSTTSEEMTTENITPTETDVDTEMKAPCTLGNLTDEQIVLVCPTGFRRHPKYCNMFYQCTSEGNMEIKVLVLVCPENTIFDENKVQCLAESESSQACDTQVASARLYRQIEKLSARPIRATSNNLCPEEGHYPYQKGCSNIFYKCRRNQKNSIQGYLYRCPDNFVYWSVSRRCERESRLSSCSQLQDVDREEMNAWKKRWEIPIEEFNLSARMMHF